MAILSFQLATIGQAGQIPTFIYFNTNNTKVEVEDPGFLNHFVAEGNIISDQQVALVVTKASPSAKVSSTDLYNISYSGGDWKLTEIGTSTSADGWLLTGNTDAEPYPTSFLGTQNLIPLAIGTSGIAVVQIGDNADNILISTDTVNIESDTFTRIDSATLVNIGLDDAATVNLGHIAPGTPRIQLSSTHTTIFGTGLTLSGFLSGPPAGLFNVLVDGSGNISFSNVANASSGTAWDVGGNTGLTNPSIFGTLDAAGINHQVNSISYLTVSSASAVVLAPSGNNSLTIGYTGLPVNFLADNFTMNTNGTIALNSALGFHVNAAGNVLVETTGTGTSQTFGNSFHLTQVYGNSIAIFAQTGGASLDCDAALDLGALATTINIGSATAVSTINATDLSLPDLPVAVAGTRPVMADPATGRLYLAP